MSAQSTQQNLPFPLLETAASPNKRYDRKLTQQQLEAHLWGAANILRGKTAGQDYKNYILSLMFYKRLCDQWECEADEAIAELERQQGRCFTEQQKAIFRRRGEHRFTIPDGSRWGDVKAVSTDIDEVLTKAMRAVAEANEELRGVFTVDWHQPAPDGSGKPLIANEVVHALIQHFDEHDLSNSSVPPDILGRAYEYLIKQFADDAGAKAGEFFTPPEVVDTLVRMLEPRPGDTVYDPTAGSGGMLVHAADYLRELSRHASSARFGRGAGFKAPPAAYGDYAFILHIVAALDDDGRAGIVCPQGVLFRGQPEIEEETGEFDEDGNPKLRRRKADDEHLIRKALLDARLIDAVISLPLNVFYGAGVPACLLVLHKERPPERRDRVLLIYAARHYRQLSAKNELRPQDVMRILVHYHAYGDAAKVPGLVAAHSGRIRGQIDLREEDEIGRLQAECQAYADRLAALDAQTAAARARHDAAATRGERNAAAAAIAKLQRQRERPAAKLAERDERIAEARRRAEDDRRDIEKVGSELIALYADPDELLKHARVVDIDEIEENEFNLNIPRYVDTFEPEPRIEVADALRALDDAQKAAATAEAALKKLLDRFGYAAG